MQTTLPDTLIETVAAELDAVMGDQLNDLEFSALVDQLVAEEQAAPADTFYVLVPDLAGNTYTAAFADGSMGPATRQQLVKAGRA